MAMNFYEKSGRAGSSAAVIALLLLAAVGGGAYFWKAMLNNEKLELEGRKKQAELQLRQEKAKERAAEESAAKANALAKERELKRVQAEKEKLIAENEKKKLDNEGVKAKAEAAKAEAAKSEAAARASAAAKAKLDAERAKAEAEEKALACRNESERVALAKAEADRAKAAAERESKAMALRIAEAALAKSENERKAAEAKAAEERDRKLRMYRRAETSRAEMLELQRAERMLALEEAGISPTAIYDDEEPIPADGEGVAAAAQGETPPPVEVDWRNGKGEKTPADRKIEKISEGMDGSIGELTMMQARRHVKLLSGMIREAQTDSEKNNYRRALASLAPNYMEVYRAMIGEALQEKRTADARRLCREMVSTIPVWERTGKLAGLLERDLETYSALLAGNTTQDEFVRAFRRVYDGITHRKGDADERAARTEELCRTLAKYVPEYERHAEWR